MRRCGVCDIARFVVSPSESKLDFEAASTLHPVHGSATGVSGYVDAEFAEGALVIDPAPAMHVEIPVERLRSGNEMQDREMWKLIDSRRFPILAADLRALAAGAGGDRYRASGDVTFAGRVRRYDGDLAIARSGDGILVEGDLALDIRDFGIQPPRFLMFKVLPDVKVRLRLRAVEAAPAAAGR